MNEIFEDEKNNKKSINNLIEYKNQYSGLEFLLGSETIEKIRNSKIFMVGAGAIGCELLKNYAMIGLGSGEKG